MCRAVSLVIRPLRPSFCLNFKEKRQKYKQKQPPKKKKTPNNSDRGFQNRIAGYNNSCYIVVFNAQVPLQACNTDEQQSTNRSFHAHSAQYGCPAVSCVHRSDYYYSLFHPFSLFLLPGSFLLSSFFPFHFHGICCRFWILFPLQFL